MSIRGTSSTPPTPPSLKQILDRCEERLNTCIVLRVGRKCTYEGGAGAGGGFDGRQRSHANTRMPQAGRGRSTKRQKCATPYPTVAPLIKVYIQTTYRSNPARRMCCECSKTHHGLRTFRHCKIQHSVCFLFSSQVSETLANSPRSLP